MEDKWIIPSYTLSTNLPPEVKNIPSISGKYLVVIGEYSEYRDGYCEYSQPAYITTMDIVINEDEEEWDKVTGKGANDEEWDMIVAWMGPIPPIPEEVK